MERRVLIILVLIVSFGFGCNDKNKFSHSKFYDYVIENQLPSQIIKIVPFSKSDFWISSEDTLFIYPGTKSIIGSKTCYDNNRKIIDKYKQNDTIENFDIYIDNIKQKKILSQRISWNFTFGSVDESAIYSLIINQSNIILK
jgi:hypothetical protein